MSGTKPLLSFSYQTRRLFHNLPHDCRILDRSRLKVDIHPDELMPRNAFQTIYDIAEDQLGYISTAQAKGAGVDRKTLWKMHRNSVLERTSHGVYRLVNFPASAHAQYMEAVLWPAGERGVISHESALALHGMSDASPARIHVTVPASFRVRRDTPPVLVLHHADLAPEEVDYVEGIPVTSAVRTVRDCHEANLGPALLRQAVEDGRRTGALGLDAADRLERELFGAATGNGAA